MKYKKYQHVEHFGHPNVEGIEFGKCYIFPKIDGTNGVCYVDNGLIKYGNRHRVLSLEEDNQGFMAKMIKDEKVEKYLNLNPNHVLYGEYLIPHTEDNYRDDAWDKFYIFDVYQFDETGGRYLSFDEYKPLLKQYGLSYINPIAVMENGSFQSFVKLLDKNTFLMKDGCVGEGIVIKNYDYKNDNGHTIWAKIVTNDFKERFYDKMGPTPMLGEVLFESEVIDKLLTTAFIDKEYVKFKRAKDIPNYDTLDKKHLRDFFDVSFNVFVEENILIIISRYKNPNINFGFLKKYFVNKVKEHMQDRTDGIYVTINEKGHLIQTSPGDGIFLYKQKIVNTNKDEIKQVVVSPPTFESGY